MNEALLPLTAEPIAAADLDPPVCEQCSNPFSRRTGSGGKPQRFCSTECRRLFHAANVPTPKAGIGETESEAIPQPIAQRPIPEPPRPEEFDWLTNELVVLKEQPATAIYFNPGDDLVIRQKAAWDREEDSFIFIAPGNAQEFLDRLCDVLGIVSVGR